MTVYVSYDEGETWPASKCIVPYSSAYSSLCVLPDGTIGLYVEEEPNNTSGYSTVFYNFSLDWLTDGNDHYTAVTETTDTWDSLHIYPIPASSFITIETEGMSSIELYNANGQLVKSISAKGVSEVRIDISKLASGLYLVKAFAANGQKKDGRFVIQ